MRPLMAMLTLVEVLEQSIPDLLRLVGVNGISPLLKMIINGSLPEETLVSKTQSAQMEIHAESVSTLAMLISCKRLAEVSLDTGQQIRFAVLSQAMEHPSTASRDFLLLMMGSQIGTYTPVLEWDPAISKGLIQVAADVLTGKRKVSLSLPILTLIGARIRTQLGKKGLRALFGG